MPFPAALSGRDMRWWLSSDDGGPLGEVHNTIMAIVKELRDKQSYRTDRDLIHMCLYGSDLVQGFGVASYTLTNTYAGTPLSVNIVRSVIDTLVAKIVKSKPRPMWMTDGADWELQQKAKKLNKYSEGLFYANKVYRFNRGIVRDALVFGLGAAKNYERSSKPALERTFTPELYVNDSEAKYGDPRTLYHLRTIDRMVLAEMFPERRDDIMETHPATVDDWQMVNMSRDQIDVVEAWHLPSGPKADDGKHAIIIDNYCLLFENWDEDKFPFAFLRYAEPILGWYGTGLAQILAGKQFEINKLLTEIQRSFHLGSNMRVFVERGSKIVKSHFNNEIGSILEYTGVAPTLAVAQTVHPEKFQHLLWLIDSSYKEAGINAMTAAGQKDQTLKSGKAQMVALDVEDSRFAEFGQAYEEFCMDEATMLLECARRIGAKPVIYIGKREMETVELPDISTEQTALEVFPTSQLASTPQARMEQVQDLVNAGWLTPESGRRLLDFPELEDDNELADAPYNSIRSALERMYNELEYQQPLPQMDLKQALQLSVAYFLDRRTKFPGQNSKGLELILAFMVEVQNMMSGASGGGGAPELSGQSPVEGAPTGPGGPPGPPGPPPPNGAPPPAGGPPPPPQAPPGPGALH